MDSGIKRKEKLFIVAFELVKLKLRECVWEKHYFET